MDQAMRQVVEFEKAAGHELSNRKPQVPDMKTAELRFKLIAEESKETLDALTEIMLDMSENEPVRNDKLAEFADGLADLIWVAIGSAIHFGIDLPAVFQEVDRTNMAKFGPGSWVREDFKIMKPPSWTPPDIEGILASQSPLSEIYGGGRLER